MTVLKRGVAHGNCKSTANTNHDRRRGARFEDARKRLVENYFQQLRRAKQQTETS